MGVGAIRRVVKQAGNARSSFNLSQQPSRSQRRRQAECPYLEAPSSDNTAQQRLSSGSKEAKHDVPCPSNHGNDGFHIRNTPSQKLFRIHRNRPCSPPLGLFGARTHFRISIDLETLIISNPRSCYPALHTVPLYLSACYLLVLDQTFDFMLPDAVRTLGNQIMGCSH